MSEFRVANFERGMTDHYVNADLNYGQKFENLLISRNRKIFSRDGSALYDSTLPRIPSSSRIQYSKYHEGFLFEFSGDEIYYRDTTHKELVGPVDSYDAFGDLGSSTTSHNSSASWQKHLYTTIDTYCRPRKIYRDQNDVWQIRNAGLPSPGDVRGFTTACTLANSLKTVYNAHVADIDEHSIADTAVSSANATDINTLITLCNELKTRYIAHLADALLVTPSKHLATGTSYPLSESNDIVTLDQAINLLNDIKAKYNLHDADATAHQDGSEHQEATTSATRSFTVTPEAANGCTYIYGLLYKYTYMVDTVTYVDRSGVTEVSVTNAGNFGAPGQGNDLTLIPALTNVIFGTKEAWDTANIVVEIYRTATTGTVLKKAAEISNGTTSYDDAVTDANLGEEIYTNGGILNNEEPPPCKYVVNANDMNFYLDVKEDSEEKNFRIRHTKQFQLGSSPAAFKIDVDGAITGGGAIGINPIVFTEDKCFRLEGVVDDTGAGFIKKRIIDDTVGCVSHNSIIPVKDGLYFAAKDGFYFTDGFKTSAISKHLNDSYKLLVATDSIKKRIYGKHDPLNDLMFWAVTQDSDDGNTDNDALWVHDRFWGAPNGQGTFTTWTFGDNGTPSALECINGNIVRSDALGYTFAHDSDLANDLVIDTTVAPSSWVTTPVIYDYISSAFPFGSEYQRKWVTKLLTILKSVTNVSVQPYSINDDSGAFRALREIRNRALFEWGDDLFEWGDDLFEWNASVTGTFIRHFPRDGLRCTYKQVRYTNSETIIANSDTFGAVTINSSNVATLSSGEFSTTDLVNYYFVVGSDRWLITAASSNSLTLSDVTNTLPASAATWTIVGMKRSERFHLEGYTTIYSMFGVSHRAYKSGDDGANAA